jgi:uncharacterized membrane protein HdeD (DUF308 family)
MKTVGSMNPTGGLAQRADSPLSSHRWLFVVEGVALVLIGITAIALPTIATLAFEIFVGWLLLLSGFIGGATTLSNRRSAGFVWSLVSAIVAIIAGVVLLRWPLSGAVSLTVILILFFLLEGFASIMFALAHRRNQTASWRWMFASGLIDLGLAALILTGLPGTSIWAIGLLLGINLIFGGSALLTMSVQRRGLAVRAARQGG